MVVPILFEQRFEVFTTFITIRKETKIVCSLWMQFRLLAFTREEQVQIAVAIFFEYFFCIPGNVANSLLKFLNTPDLRPFNAFLFFHNAGRYFLIYFRTILCYPFMSVAFYTYSVCLENRFFLLKSHSMPSAWKKFVVFTLRSLGVFLVQLAITHLF